MCRRTVLLSRSTISTVSAFRWRVSASTLRKVLHAGAKRRNLPDKSYAEVKAPFLYSLARLFNIHGFIWQQQGDGEVFVGSWADSFFGVRPPLQLPAELFDDYQGNQSAMIAALPGLRPGATINHGERITSVALVDNQMAIRWTTQSSAA